MKFSKIIIFFFSFTFLNNIFINSFISLDFTYINKKTAKSTPSTGNAAEYLDSLISNPIYTNLILNNKEIKFHVTMDRYLSYISEKTLKEIDPIAADEKNEKGNLYSLDYVGISRAVLTNSSFTFHINDKEDLDSYYLSFFMSKKMINNTREIKEYCYATENEEIGFNINKGNKIFKATVEYDPREDDYREDDDYGDDYDYSTDTDDKEPKILQNNGLLLEDKTNLITQLKEKNLISSYSFFIKYNQNEEKGQIIIGSLPHEFDPKSFKEEDYSVSYIDLENGIPNWKKKFDSINYGETSININYLTVEFSINSGFIIAPKANKDFFDTNFFNLNKNYCNEELIGDYYIKYCQKKAIKNLKNLSFNLASLQNEKVNKLEFNYNDLFIKPNKNEDRYYFQIVFKSGYYQWTLGRPMFKKYPMVFDQNKKIFGFYENKKENESDDNKLSLAWILVIILIVILSCIIAFGVICYFKIKSEKRKKRAAELIDDNYEYKPAQDNNNNQGDDKNKLYQE